MKFLFFLLHFCWCCSIIFAQEKGLSPSDKRAVEQTLKLFQLSIERPELWGAILEDLKPYKEKGGAELVLRTFEPRYQKLIENYEKEFVKVAGKFQEMKFRETEKKLRELINEAKKVFANVDKETTKSSWEKMSEIKSLIFPASKDILTSNKVLENERKKIYEMGKIIKYFKNGEMIDLDSLEWLIIARTIPFADKVSQKIMATNDGANVPIDIRIGIADLNVMRLVFGKNALAIDAKLCACATDHSKDMKEKNFFAHESPVPGKKSPWDRAKNFGTSASAENIAMGSNEAIGSNTQWYLSPGHFVNMFAEHVRVGLGNSGNYWTQMFGR